MSYYQLLPLLLHMWATNYSMLSNIVYITYSTFILDDRDKYIIVLSTANYR